MYKTVHAERWVRTYVVVEFGRKVFLVDCLITKNIKYGEYKHNTNTPRVTIQENITAMRYRNDVIRPVLLLHICANLGMMLARDYASCHAARSTLLIRVANNVQTLRWTAKVWI